MGVVSFKRDPGLWAGLLFIGMFMGTVDVMIGVGLVRAVRSRHFEPTPGVVTRSEVVGGHKGSADFKLEYTYTVNGVRFTGKDYHVDPQLVGNGYWFKARDALPVGTPVTVYFDPSDPADAVLVPGVRPDAPLVVWMLTPFNLILVGLSWGAWWSLSGRRAFDPRLARCVRPTPGGWRVRASPVTGFAVHAFLGLFAISFAGFFVGGAFVLLLDSPPWWLSIGLWVVGLTGATAYGWHASRQKLIHINEPEGTISFPEQDGRETVAREAVLGLDLTPEQREKDRGKFEVFVVAIRWRNDFDREESTTLAEYDDRADAEALVAWMSERLGVGEKVGHSRE